MQPCGGLFVCNAVFVTIFRYLFLEFDVHLPVHAMPTTKPAAEQRTCYLPLIEFCADQYDKQFCDNTDKSGHMGHGERFGNGATRLCSAPCCITWGPERKRNGLLGLLCYVYSNIRIRAFDA
jgi:hypothetical protein